MNKPRSKKEKRGSRGDKKRNGPKSSGKKWAIGVGIVLALGLIGFLVWYFVIRDTSDDIDYCEVPVYCIPSNTDSARDVNLSESDKSRLASYLGLESASIGESDISGFRNGPIDLKETLKWMGENLKLVDDQAVEFSVEELSGQQIVVPPSLFPPEFPVKDKENIVFSYIRVIPGSFGSVLTTTEPFKQQACAQLSCSESSRLVPKKTFSSSGQCPECRVISGTACSSDSDCSGNETCLSGQCFVTCNADADCGPNETCLGSTCVAN